MVDLYKGKGVTKIVGIESRGFVMSSAVATRLGAGIVLCRKPGKAFLVRPFRKVIRRNMA